MAYLEIAPNIWSETTAGASASNGAAPTLVTDGFPVKGLSSLHVMISSASGTTLSGAGSEQAYVLFPTALGGRWARFPAADLATTSAGIRDLASPPLSVVVLQGACRMAFVPAGITFSAGSAGTTVTVVGQSYSDLVVNQGNNASR